MQEAGEVKRSQIQGEGCKSMATEEAIEKGDTLKSLCHDLFPSEIDTLKVFETICAQNTSLTHEVILLEEQNRALRSINRNLEYLLKLKDKPTSSSPPPSPKKET
jgi:hypothetical protein